MNKVFIIAEAGVNHNGNFEIAKKLVDVAKESGADYVKFQTFIPESVVSKFAQKADYQKQTTDKQESQLDMVKKLFLPFDSFLELHEYCISVGIGFISTPFDFESISFLESLNMDFWKVPSGEITNLPYLEKIAETRRKVVMSTGMSNIDEIKNAISILEKNGSHDISLLHCNTQYPTPYCDVNLKAIDTLRKTFNKKVGYSDHTLGIEVPIAAVAMGASIIEKHFTLSKDMVGPDHRSSLEPHELKSMVESIRNIEKAFGSGDKIVSASEKNNLLIARKSIVARKKIKKGELFSIDNITVKRPACGLSPMKWHEVIGQTAKRDYTEDEFIEL